MAVLPAMACHPETNPRRVACLLARWYSFSLSLFLTVHSDIDHLCSLCSTLKPLSRSRFLHSCCGSQATTAHSHPRLCPPSLLLSNPRFAWSDHCWLTGKRQPARVSARDCICANRPFKSGSLGLSAHAWLCLGLFSSPWVLEFRPSSRARLSHLYAPPVLSATITPIINIVVSHRPRSLGIIGLDHNKSLSPTPNTLTQLYHTYTRWPANSA